MKALPLLLLSAAAALFAVGCNLESVDTAGSTSSAAKNASSTTSVDTASTSTPVAKTTTPSTTTKSTTTTKTTTPSAAPVANPSALFVTTPNSLTLRSDFAAVVGRIDALTKINEGAGGSTSVAVQATRSGNTWTLPQSLASYPTGNRPNTWRIRLLGRPPAGVTYHTSISQTFIRVGDNPYGAGSKTYPPTTRP